MTTVCTVLRSGGIYDASWVARLERAVTKYLAPDRFVCLSDVDVPCERIELIHDWPGWWSKLELWRPGLFEGQVFFVDLDTLILEDCREIWKYEGRFAALQDFTRSDIKASGLLLWRAGEVRLYEQALKDAQSGQHSDRLLRPRVRMDPWWNHHERQPDVLQDLFPGMIGSFKIDKLEPDPDGHRIVCFHGKPRPEDVSGWVAEAWAA